MSDQQGTVEYVLRLKNEISGPAEEASESLAGLEGQSDRAARSIDDVRAKSIEAMAAMHSVQSGLSAVVSSTRTLGLVSEETSEKLAKAAAGIQLVVGAAQTLKGVTAAFGALRAAINGTAVAAAVMRVVQNPVAGLAAVAAAGLAGGYMLATLTRTSISSTTINSVPAGNAGQVRNVDMSTSGAWYRWRTGACS